jgi:photosystem II stability/assembly factor-like uncharacterized protein
MFGNTLRMKFIFLFLAMAAMRLETLPAQINVWTNLGPDGGAIGAMAVDPNNSNTAYAARGNAGGGLFKTTDGGASWHAINSGLLTTMPVSALAIDSRDPNTLYAGIRFWPGGLFKSIDGGKEWLQVTLPTSPRSVGVVFSLAIVPDDPDTIYVAIGGPNGLFKSSDRGQSWNAVNFGFGASSELLAFAIDPQISTTMYAATGDGWFKSEDGGGSWRLLRAGRTSNGVVLPVLAPDPHRPGTVYIASTVTNGRGLIRTVLKSTDGGETWIPLESTFPPDIGSIAFDNQDPNTLYVGTGEGAFKSADAGATWTAQRIRASFITALAVDAQNAQLIYGAADVGFFVSTNGGVSWAKSPIPGYVGGLATDRVNANTVYVTGNGVFNSADAGNTWGLVGNKFGLGPLIVDPKNPSTFYASSYGGGVWKSTDGGSQWTVALTAGNLDGSSPLAIDPQSPDTLYAGTGGGIFKSTDGGTHWSRSGLEREYPTALALDPRNPSTIYAGTGNGVFKSSDGGETWNAMSFGLPGGFPTGFVTALIVHPQDGRTVYAGTWDSGVFRSTDGGETWNALNAGLTARSVGSLAIHRDNPNTVYAGTSGGGVFVFTAGRAE